MYLIITPQQQDKPFFDEVAARNSEGMVTTDNLEKVASVLSRPKGVTVFWGIDTRPDLAEKIDKMLQESISPNHVWVISSKPINQLPELLSYRSFGHSILRRYEPAVAASQIVARVVSRVQKEGALDAAGLLPAGTQIHRVVLKSSKQRVAMTGAVLNVCRQLGISDRLAAVVSQGVDELVLNAIFSAPVNAGLVRYRSNLQRTAEISLSPHEEVVVELGYTPDYVVLGITDQFGSLNPGTLMAHLRRNYEDHDYLPRSNASNAGLGLYGLVQSGLSLLIATQKKTRTTAFLLLPVTPEFRAFKEGFRYVGLLDLEDRT